MSENNQELMQEEIQGKKNSFFSEICNIYSRTITRILRDGEDTEISVWFDYETLLFHMQAKNSKNTYDLIMPDFPRSIMMSYMVAMQSGNAQKIIDSLAEDFKRNIEFAMKYDIVEPFKVTIGETCVYKHHMYWFDKLSYKDETEYVFFHPYFKTRHPEVYQKIADELHEKIGMKEKPWNESWRFSDELLEMTRQGVENEKKSKKE